MNCFDGVQLGPRGCDEKRDVKSSRKGYGQLTPRKQMIRYRLFLERATRRRNDARSLKLQVKMASFTIFKNLLRLNKHEIKKHFYPIKAQYSTVSENC